MPTLAPLPMPSINAGPAAAPRLRVPDLRLDPRLLELDEFFPPGAQRVGPPLAVAPDLAAEEKTRFPSTELCASPDKRHVLFHDGMKRQKRGERSDIYHWLMLLKHDAPFPNAIFLTRLAFEASWAGDSNRFVVTHFLGDNSSEVFVVDTYDLERRPIDVRPLLVQYFPKYLGTVPMFVKAYRWTRDGRLVVRAIGRAREEPYELFGVETAVVFDGLGAEPRLQFLRGFIKGQEEP